MKERVFRTVMVVLISLAILFIVYCISVREIRIEEYQNLDRVAQEFPELRPMVQDAYRDDIIDRMEYNDIMSCHESLKKKRMLRWTK